YKVTDRDGLYVAVSPTGTRSFRYGYRINGRRETLTIGQYGADGISLAEAREQLIAAKKLIKSGVSPAVKKRDGKNQIRNAETFANFTVSYMKRASLADSTRSMKQA
ncbi:Arm DNA-binding domain-containing protein, partial [Salmonella enterica]